MDETLVRLLAPLAADPAHAGVVCDIDGTLAPIVARVEDAAVPEDALAALAALRDRYALVACVTGRPAEKARAMVPVEGVAIVGNHGLETIEDGRVALVEEARPWAETMYDAELECENDRELARLGARVEDKGITFSIHFREAPDETAVRRYLDLKVLRRLRHDGLAWRYGRKVLDVHPPLPIDKGTALRRLRSGRDLHCLLYVGDDRTDVDAFREADVRLAVRSDEAPEELIGAADAAVDSPAEVVSVLRHLAQPARV